MAGLFHDLGLLNRDQKTGIGFFPSSPPALNKADIPKLVTEAAAGCSPEEIKALTGFVETITAQIQAPHTHQVKKIVQLCFSGLKTIPGYQPPEKGPIPTLK